MQASSLLFSFALANANHLLNYRILNTKATTVSSAVWPTLIKKRDLLRCLQGQRQVRGRSTSSSSFPEPILLLVMLRSVPKYVAIISIDNYLDEALTGEAKFCKGSLAGIGAVLLTNPFDSLHAEYLKAEKLSLVSVIKREGLSLLSKGLAPNMIAVVLPTTVTILVSDILKTWKYSEYADL